MTLQVWIPRTVAVSVFQEVLEWCASTQQNSGSKPSEGCIRSERRADGTLQIFNTQQVINTSGSLSPFPNILNAHTCLPPRQIYRRCCPIPRLSVSSTQDTVWGLQTSPIDKAHRILSFCIMRFLYYWIASSHSDSWGYKHLLFPLKALGPLTSHLLQSFWCTGPLCDCCLMKNRPA